MKSLTAFALVILSCVPAMAQFGGMGGTGLPSAPPTRSIEAELLEMEQAADKTALQEALLLQARQGMEPRPEGQKNLVEAQVVALREFIAKKKQAISARDAELRKNRGSKPPAATAARKPPQFDWRAEIEKSENARIESQLLQAQVELLEPELTKAIEVLAAAEHVASKDDNRRAKADEARRAYEKIKAQYVEHSKQLLLEQEQWGGKGGGKGFMGGGMGGMGGGMGGMGGQGMM